MLDLQATVDIDVPGCDTLRQLAEDLERDDIKLGLTRVRTVVREMFDKTGVVDAVGADRILMSDATAVAAFASRTGATPDPDAVAEEAAAALGELAGLLDDDAVSQRLQRAIDALDADQE